MTSKELEEICAWLGGYGATATATSVDVRSLYRYRDGESRIPVDFKTRLYKEYLKKMKTGEKLEKLFGVKK